MVSGEEVLVSRYCKPTAKLVLPESLDVFVPKRLMRGGIETLHIDHRHALHLTKLPFLHHDPFDRWLIA